MEKVTVSAPLLTALPSLMDVPDTNVLLPLDNVLPPTHPPVHQFLAHGVLGLNGLLAPLPVVLVLAPKPVLSIKPQPMEEPLVLALELNPKPVSCPLVVLLLVFFLHGLHGPPVPLVELEIKPDLVLSTPPQPVVVPLAPPL